MEVGDHHSRQQDSTTRSQCISGEHPPLSSTAPLNLHYPNFSQSAIQIPSKAAIPSASPFRHLPIAPSQAGNNPLILSATSPTGFAGAPPIIGALTCMGGPPVPRPPLQRPPLPRPPIQASPISGSSMQAPQIQGLPGQGPPLQELSIKRPPVPRPQIPGPPIQRPPIQGLPLPRTSIQRPPMQGPLIHGPPIQRLPAQGPSLQLARSSNQGSPFNHAVIYTSSVGIPRPQCPNRGSSTQGSQPAIQGISIHGPPMLPPPLQTPLHRPEVQEPSSQVPSTELSSENLSVSSGGAANPAIAIPQQMPQVLGVHGAPKTSGGEAICLNSADVSGREDSSPGLRPLLDPPHGVGPQLQGAVIPSGGGSGFWYKYDDERQHYSHCPTKESVLEMPANSRLMFEPLSNRLWSQHQTPEGKLYYFNRVTQHSVWEKPKDFDSNMPASMGHVPGHSHNEPTPSDVKISDEEVTAQADAVKNQSGEEELQYCDDAAQVNTSNEKRSSAEPNHASTVVTSPQIQALPQPILDHQSTLTKILPLPVMECLVPPSLPTVQLPLIKVPVREEVHVPRPVKSIPVAGTPWSIVWSSDNRRFFFDATNRVSVWNIPKDLENNPTVLMLLEEAIDGKKRSHESMPSPEAKRLKVDEDELEEDVMDTDDKTLVVEDEEISTISSEGVSILDKLKTSKSFDERQREFKEMLLDRGVSAFSTWEKELPKFVFDPRCKLLTVKERKTCFEEYIVSRADEERKERKSKLKEKKENFRLLLEEAQLHSKSNFSDFVLKYGKDARFKGVEKMREREQIFSDYLVELKRLSKQKEQKSFKSRDDVVKRDFMAMLMESDSITQHTQWKKVKSMFDHDPRYKAVESSTLREEWFMEHFKLKVSQKVVDYDRQERIQASLKEREREVKLSRFAHEKEWNRERDQLRKMEALQHFKALLVDMVRTPEKLWHEVKRNLRQDHRWELASLLDTSDKEKLFQQHVEQLMKRKRVLFRQLLEETSQISLSMPWRKVRKLIKNDPRYKNYGDSDHRREAEYSEYLKDRLVEAKNEFRALLRETKAITYRSYDMIKEADRHHKDIVDILRNDQRYLVLECVPDERMKILDSYIEDLHYKGPPPPPTATNPGERLKRPPAT